MESFIELLRAIKQIQKCLILAVGNHEQALVEQGFLGSPAGAVEDEIGQRFMRYFGCTAQHGFLFGRGAKAEPGSTGSGGGGNRHGGVRM